MNAEEYENLRAAIVCSISEDELQSDWLKIDITGRNVLLRVRVADHPFYGPTYEFYDVEISLKKHQRIEAE